MRETTHVGPTTKGKNSLLKLDAIAASHTLCKDFPGTSVKQIIPSLIKIETVSAVVASLVDECAD